MTNTICGHGRDVLIWVLSVHVRERCLMAPCELSETEAQSASDAVHDPAKLAEMLAERGRELGWNTYSDDVYDMPVFPCIDFTVDEGVITIDVWRSMHDLESGKNEQRLGMPQARAVLLQWLQLPDGAREEAEKALRGET